MLGILLSIISFVGMVGFVRESRFFMFVVCAGHGNLSCFASPAQARQSAHAGHRCLKQYLVVVLVFAIIELCLAVAAIVNAEKVRSTPIPGNRLPSPP